MIKIHVTRAHSEGNKWQLFGISHLALSLALGMALGGTLITHDRSFLNVKTSQNLASVSASITKSTPIEEIQDLPSTKPPEEKLGVNTTPPPTITSVSRATPDPELFISIRDKEIAIDRLVNRVEQIRIQGIRIVRQFDVECGAWISACGEKFTQELNANNELFLETEALLKTQQDELTQLRTTLTQIP